MFYEQYYNVSPSDNPVEPDNGEWKVIRGGSWSGFESDLLVSARNYATPDEKYVNLGFRIVYN